MKTYPRKDGKAQRTWVMDRGVPTEEVLARSGDRVQKERAILRQVHRREGRCVLRTNLSPRDPATLWRMYTHDHWPVADDATLFAARRRRATAARATGAATAATVSAHDNVAGTS